MSSRSVLFITRYSFVELQKRPNLREIWNRKLKEGLNSMKLFKEFRFTGMLTVIQRGILIVR